MSYLSLSNTFPKNVLIIAGDMNAHIGKDENNKYCFDYSINRNEEHLPKCSLGNRLVCLDTKFQKRKGKMWTYTDLNNSIAQQSYISINKKLINYTINCEASSSFEGVFSDHRFGLGKIGLSLRRNKKQTRKALWYDWFSLKRDKCNHYSIITARNGFDTLQEISERNTPSDEYENFVPAHLEAEAQHRTTKPKSKRSLGNKRGQVETRYEIGLTAHLGDEEYDKIFILAFYLAVNKLIRDKTQTFFILSLNILDS